MATEITVSSGASVVVTTPTQSSIQVNTSSPEAVTVSGRGAKGDKGEVGATGATGATGAAGAAGPTYTVSCVDGDNSDEEKIRLTASTGDTDDVVLEAGTGMTISRSGDKITFTNAVTDTDTVLSAEQVQDIVGAMFSSNTETRISATYQDGDGTIDLVVDDMTANDNTQNTYAISCVDGDNSDEEKIRLTQGGAGGASTDDIVLEAGTGLSVARSGDKITFTNTVSDTNTQLSAEAVQDIVGAMFSSNTETRITATYQDGDGTVDLVVDDMTANDNTTYGVSCVDGDNSDEEKIRLTDSSGGTDDVVLEAGTGLSVARSGDKITFTNTVTDTNTTDLSTDSSPQLGGDLDVNGNDIVSTSNADIDIKPNGSGKVVIDSASASSGVKLSDGHVEIFSGTGSAGKIDFYCESSAAHKVTVQSPAHSAFSGDVQFTLPSSNGSDGQVLKTDGSGNLSYVNQTADTQLSTEQVQDITGAMFSSNTESGITATYQDGDGTIDLEVGSLTVAQGGTGSTSFADKAVLITQDSGTDTVAAATMSTNGQLLIGGTSGPAVATLTAGSNVTITNADGAITIAAAGDGGGGGGDIEGVTAGDGLSGGGTTGSVTLNVGAAQTTITSIINTGITKIGTATDQEYIDFSTANEVNIKVNDTEQLSATSSGVDIRTELSTAKNVFTKTANTDFSVQGDIVRIGTGSTTQGELCYYKSDGTWAAADADAAATSGGCLLAIALGTDPDADGMLLRGMFTLDHDPGTIADELYVSTTAGDITGTAPSGNGDIVRIVGYCLDSTNGQIWFNPSNDFIEITA